MKKSTLILSLTLITAVPAKQPNNNIADYELSYEECETDTVYTYKYETLYTGIYGTTYHAVPEQTDDTPLITADGSFIDTTRVNELRWVALSRDLLKLKTRRYNFKGKIKFGDTIYIQSSDPRISGPWVVKDSMGAYFWKEQKLDPSEMTDEMYATKEYKVANGKVYKKFYQHKWIDFLQCPKTGFLAAWKKRDIVIKTKKVLSYTIVQNCN